MKFWLVERHDDVMSYDETHAAVVRAQDEQSARQLVANINSDEGGAIWFDPQTTCDRITARGPAQILLVDYNEA